MKLRNWILSVFVVTMFSLGCSKSEGTSSSSAPAAQKGGDSASAASVKDLEAKLQKAGWTFDSSEDNNDAWPARRIEVKKEEGDVSKSATVWIEDLGTSLGGKPKPHIVVGKGALLRFVWDPRDAAKPAVDLVGLAKDIVAITPPEKATDDLGRSEKYGETLKKWGLSAGSGNGSLATNADVIFNNRTASNDAGTVVLDIVHYQKALEEGRAKLLGMTLVSVWAKESATAKEVLAAL